MISYRKSQAITLIGMPSVGKSSVGMELAKRLSCEFLDLDSMVEKEEGRTLVEILPTLGSEYFLDLEFKILNKLHLPANNTVISPAGSIIYHQQSINWIEANTYVIHLKAPLDVIDERLKCHPKAVVGLEAKGLEVLWLEREPMYSKVADLTVESGNKSVLEVTNQILNLLLPKR